MYLSYLCLSDVSSIDIEQARTKNFYVDCMLIARYWGQRENKEKTYTLFYFKQETNESLFNYSPWLMNMLREVVHCAVDNKYTGKKICTSIFVVLNFYTLLITRIAI